MNTFRRSGLVVLGVALAGLVLLLAFAATTRVFAPPPTRCPRRPPPPPAMQQTVDSTTLTIQPIYADASRIVLTGTVSVTEGQGQYMIWGLGPKPTLQTAGGAALREVPETRWAVDGQPLWGVPHAEDVPPGGPLGLTSDAAPVAQQGDLDLNLQVSLTSCPPRTIGCRPRGPSAGPFAFHFHMPVDPLRRVTVVQQTLLGYTTALTLDQAIATRHETRMDLRYDDGVALPANLPRDMPFPFEGVQSLQAGDRSLSFAFADQAEDVFTDSGTLSLLTSTLALPGNWTLNLWLRPRPVRPRWAVGLPLPHASDRSAAAGPHPGGPAAPATSADAHAGAVCVADPDGVSAGAAPSAPSGELRLPTPVRSTGPRPAPTLTATGVAPEARPTK